MKPLRTSRLLSFSLVAGLLLASSATAKRNSSSPKEFSADLGADDCTFTDLGRNRYFVLEPGHQLQFAGEVKDGFYEVTKTVLHDTRLIDGVRTRLVEEVETLDGQLVEISQNFYALCKETAAVFYFGEAVELFQDGVVISGEGSWEAGVDGAKAGIAMPGTFLIGARYHQEIAPGVAMDRVVNLDAGLSFTTAAGSFENCVRTLETTPLEPGERTIKVHAEGVGVVVDDVLQLVSWTPSDLALEE